MLHHMHHTNAGTFVSNVHLCWTYPKYCYHFIRHGGEIEGKFADIRPRRSPNPSGELEVKLNLTFTAEGPIMHMMRQFLVLMGLHWGAGVCSYNIIIFESRFMKFVLLFVKKLYFLPKKIQKFSKKFT